MSMSHEIFEKKRTEDGLIHLVEDINKKLSNGKNVIVDTNMYEDFFGKRSNWCRPDFQNFNLCSFANFDRTR